MRGTITVLFFLLAGCLAWSQGAPSGTAQKFVGCVRGEHNLYILERYDHTRYLLQGHEQQLKQHLNKMVRIVGQPGANANEASPTQVLVVQAVQPAPGSCQGEPHVSDQRVSGKQGMEEVSPPVSSTTTAGLTTPGVQTESGLQQQGIPYTMPWRGEVNPPTYGAKQAAPPNFDEAGQSETQANINAAAAARAEVTAGQGLGIKGGTAASLAGAQAAGAMENLNPNANSGPMAVGARASEGRRQPTTASTVSAAGMSLTDRGFHPAQVSIRSGEAVTLTNNTRRACGLRGDSISGMLKPGQNYRQTFSQPGKYKFSCGAASGEITVR